MDYLSRLEQKLGRSRCRVLSCLRLGRRMTGDEQQVQQQDFYLDSSRVCCMLADLCLRRMDVPILLYGDSLSSSRASAYLRDDDIAFTAALRAFERVQTPSWQSKLALSHVSKRRKLFDWRVGGAGRSVLAQRLADEGSGSKILFEGTSCDVVVEIQCEGQLSQLFDYALCHTSLHQGPF